MDEGLGIAAWPQGKNTDLITDCSGAVEITSPDKSTKPMVCHALRIVSDGQRSNIISAKGQSVPNLWQRLHCNTIKRLLACVLICAFQTGCGLAQQYSTVSYGAAAGLSNLNVSQLLETQSGHIWVGTENGLFLANGSSFEKQPAFQNAGIEQIRSLREDSVGRIWALDADSLAYQEAGVVHAVPALNSPDFSQDADLMVLNGEPNAVFFLNHGRLARVYTPDQGRSWQVVSAFPDGFLALHPELKKISTVTAAGRRSFWAACGNALCLVDLERSSVQLRPLPTALAKQVWTCLYLANDGSLWAKSDNEIAVLRANSTNLQKVVRPARVHLNVKNTVITEDKQGRILFTLTRGIARLKDGHWDILNDKNGLPRQEVETLLLTRAGDVWMGAEGHGLTIWRGYDQWESWTEAQGMTSSIVWPMANDQHGGLWVANDSTVDRIDLRSHHVTSMSGRMPIGRMSALTIDRRRHVWAANADGQLFDIDSRIHTVRLAGSRLGKVYKLLEDGEGTIWVCSRIGLYSLTHIDHWKQPSLIGPEQLPAGYATYITEGHSGTLWLSTAHGLFRRIPGGVWTLIRLPPSTATLTHYMVAEGIDGTLWLQSLTPNPLLHLRLSGDSARVIGKETTATLGSDNLSFIDIDSRGWLWVGSDAGVSIFNGVRWVKCTMDDGLVWDDTDFHAFYQDPDGSVWVGTSGGISHLLHPERLFDTQAPEVHFESASLGDKPLWAGSPKEVHANIVDVQHASLNVRLLNTSYDRGPGIEYRYRLEGIDDAWQTTDNVIRYPALGPGAYVLTVVAYDLRRHQASSPATVSFRVLAPWWKRRWCLAFEGFAAVLFFGCCWRMRVRFLLRRHRVLENLVQERTNALVQEKAELSLAKADLLALSRRDSLTNLLSRAAIFEEMQRLCENTISNGRPLAYAMADLDGFKKINDKFGHVAGDAVLRTCANRLSSVLRSGELIGRYGGEEMLILLPDLDPVDVPLHVEQMREAIAKEPVMHDGRMIHVTCSFGVAWFRNAEVSLEKLIHSADEALYRAKRNGRNRVELVILGKSKL